MKRKAFMVMFCIFVPVLLLMGGIYYGFFFRASPDDGQDLKLIQTAAVSRGSIERMESVAQDEAEIVHEEPSVLRILTFNIRHGVDADGEERLDSVIQSIKETGADIIALQEVDSFMPRSGFKDQAKEIAKALGYNYVYGETINVLGVKYGNAIISAYPIIDHENKKLYSKGVETRALLKSVIDVDGVLYNIYTTHLGLNSAERIRQIEEIYKTIEKDGSPIVLMGDFNEEPYSTTMQKISDILVDSADFSEGEEQYTYAFYSDEPNTRIDRIYVDQGINIEDHFVIKSETSDHCMVAITISRFNEKKEGITTFIENNK